MGPAFFAPSEGTRLRGALARPFEAVDAGCGELGSEAFELSAVGEIALMFDRRRDSQTVGCFLAEICSGVHMLLGHGDVLKFVSGQREGVLHGLLMSVSWR